MATLAEARRRADADAQEMLAVVHGGAPSARRYLRSGLHLELERQEQSWRLMLGQSAGPIDASDLHIWRAAFGVPDGASEVGRIEARRSKFNRVVLFFVNELTWTEAE